MLWDFIFVIFVSVMAFGTVSSYTLGGYIDLLLVIALVVVVIGVMQGGPPV